MQLLCDRKTGVFRAFVSSAPTRCRSSTNKAKIKASDFGRARQQGRGAARLRGRASRSAGEIVSLARWRKSEIFLSSRLSLSTIPQKEEPTRYQLYKKEKRKAGTRDGLTKAAIVAAAAKLIESVGANGFSLRRLAKALGVGPTTIHFHFEGGIGAVSSAVAQQALAGVTRPYKPKEEPAAYLAELLLKIMEALHARPVVAKLVVLQGRGAAPFGVLWGSLSFSAIGSRTERRDGGASTSNRRRSQRPRPCDPRSPLTRLRRFLTSRTDGSTDCATLRRRERTSAPGVAPVANEMWLQPRRRCRRSGEMWSHVTATAAADGKMWSHFVFLV